MKFTDKLKKHIFLKIIAVIIGIWIVITGIDLIRFCSSDTQIKPLLCLDEYGCKCYEWRAYDGIGYTFDYGYESERSFGIKKPDHKRFEIVGIEVYSVGS